MIRLYEHQKIALQKMKNGCILAGGVGSGKSLTALSYYFTKIVGGKMEPHYVAQTKSVPLYIITTADKRDKKEWESEMVPFQLSATVDSWNNIKKYEEIKDAFFIFDEQRVVSNGSWSKAFVKISKSNQWILLSATPGDTWMDYIPVFIANGFYKNRTEFIREHVVYSRNTRYPKVERYIDCGKLIKYRRSILVEMPCQKPATQKHITVKVAHDKDLIKYVSKSKWNIYTDAPLRDAAEYCHCIRKITNSDPDRVTKLLDILEEHPKAIVFYNFDYELEILRKTMILSKIPFSEWNGHKHEAILDGDRWCYLVQYTAGCEGWNCITTDTIIFFSQNYSYKVMTQAAGRTDRINTKFKELFNYHLVSSSIIDIGIKRALTNKKKFNEGAFANGKF